MLTSISLTKLDSVEDIIERLRIKRSIFYALLAMAKEELIKLEIYQCWKFSDKAYYSTVVEMQLWKKAL